MRKEVLIAILLGGILGLAIAFGVWRVNLALTSNTQTQRLTESESRTSSNEQEQNSKSLIITEPENNALVSLSPITVKGRAEKNSIIIITSPTDEVSAVADAQGNWTGNIKLEAGANAILVMAINENRDEEIEELTVTYSTEFEEE